MALGLAAGLCLTASIAIWALISGRFDATEAQVLGSTLAASLFTLTGLIGGTVLERADARRALGQVTILVSAIALALVLVAGNHRGRRVCLVSPAKGWRLASSLGRRVPTKKVT